MKYYKGEVSLAFSKYLNDRIAIQLLDNEGQLVCVATVNIPDVILNDDEVIVKDYSENEGLLNLLVSNKITSEPLRFVQSGYVTCAVVKLLVNA